MRYFITGYMGCGKTTIGRRLANRLGHAHLDLDEYFEEKYKTSISMFFERYGEDSFRKLEHELLKEVIDKHSDIVISCGGGTPCFYNNMDLMNLSGITIYLKLAAAMLASRLSSSPFRYRRPKLQGLEKQVLLQTVTAHLLEREPYYSQSHVVLDVFEMKPVEIVDHIVSKASVK